MSNYPAGVNPSNFDELIGEDPPAYIDIINDEMWEAKKATQWHSIVVATYGVEQITAAKNGCRVEAFNDWIKRQTPEKIERMMEYHDFVCDEIWDNETFDITDLGIELT